MQSWRDVGGVARDMAVSTGVSELPKSTNSLWAGTMPRHPRVHAEGGN
jgi:hypothetical protein